MKRKLFLIILLTLGASMSMAQDVEIAQDTTVASVESSDTVAIQNVVFPRAYLGVRGGMNLSKMAYSFDPINHIYDQDVLVQPIAGIFGHFQIGKSPWAIRPELSFVGRATRLTWYDVDYRFKAKYLDLRLPVTYNFGKPNSHCSPYIMAAPMLNLACGGNITYRDETDYPRGITVPITKADINRLDASLLVGLGFDYLIETASIPLLVSLEAGYNWGFINTFAPREILNNPDVDVPSHIANPTHTSQLWQETRKNRGLEVALRLALPIDGSWCKKKLVDAPDTINLVDNLTDTIYIDKTDTIEYLKTDTIYIDRTIHVLGNHQYIKKDCYSLREMEAFITLGVDISDKRICMFNINFEFDSYKLLPESKPHLKELAEFMKRFPDIKIQVYGHTDSIGDDNYNKKLSKQRANEVIHYLTTRGVAKNRMTGEGFGEMYPYTSNATKEGRFQNRRVEIEIEELGIKVTEQSTETKKQQ